MAWISEKMSSSSTEKVEEWLLVQHYMRGTRDPSVKIFFGLMDTKYQNNYRYE